MSLDAPALRDMIRALPFDRVEGSVMILPYGSLTPVTPSTRYARAFYEVWQIVPGWGRWICVTYGAQSLDEAVQVAREHARLCASS